MEDLSQVFYKTQDEIVFPGPILNNLRNDLLNRLGLCSHHNHILSPNKEDNNMGFIEVPKPKYTRIDEIVEFVKNFYSEKGFNSRILVENHVLAIKEKEKYEVWVNESGTSYSLFITEPLFS